MALIPPDRIPDGGWVLGVNVGVIGGIPNRTTIYDDNGFGITASLDSIDNTGATDVSAAIQAAINACGVNEVVRLPDGLFRCDSILVLGTGFSNKTLRGSGPGVTTILGYANQGIVAGSGSGYFVPVTPVLVTGGLSSGSTSITCDGDISYIAAGSVIRLNFPNILDPLVYSVYGFNVNTNSSPQNQVVKVISKVGQVLQIFPPLYCDHTGEEVRVTTQSFTADGISVEDLTVDMVNYVTSGGAYSGISLLQCTNGWFKNVEAIKSLNYGLVMADCVNCQIQDSWAGELKGTGSNGAGLLFSGWSCFVFNNVLVDAFPGLETNAGSSGNVFAYNFSNGQCNTNHAPHNRFNLHEGNAWHHMMSDGYFGSESDLTVFRSYIYSAGINLRRFNRNTSVIGCIMSNQVGCGLPFITSGDSFGEAQLSLGDPWRDYDMQGTLSNRISDTEIEVTVTTGGFLSYNPPDLHRAYFYWGSDLENGIVGDVTAWSDPVATMNIIAGIPPAEDTIFGAIGPGSFGGAGIAEFASFPEIDLDVEATLVNKLSYRIDNDTLSPGGGDSLYDSEIYASTPDWWTVGLPWPPYDPESPEGASTVDIPAGIRFSESIPDEPPEITTPCTVTGSPIQGQLLTAVPGTVTGNPPPTRTWRWERDGVPIVGATSITYLLTGDDVGFDVGPVQIETNSEGVDESVATPLTILPFQGDILVVTQVANTDPVTELWRRGALTNGVSAPLQYYTVQHSGPYPTQPDNNYVYARFGTPQDNVYVFQGTISEAEAIASVP